MPHDAQRVGKEGQVESHVPHAVGGFIGQHHVHTEEAFAEWVPAGKVEWLTGCPPCDCGLKPGEARCGRET
jgi:hypothetical protein